MSAPEFGPFENSIIIIYHQLATPLHSTYLFNILEIHPFESFVMSVIWNIPSSRGIITSGSCGTQRMPQLVRKNLRKINVLLILHQEVFLLVNITIALHFLHLTVTRCSTT